MFEELFGSESLTQVYAIMVEYLTKLPITSRKEIIEILYDDACHFKKFSEDEKRAATNEITRFMADKVGKHVDKFHFPNHVDAWCHKNCNPADVKHLEGVNTPICEQLFSAINKFTNTKSMNEAHFFLFFLYIFDLHNLNIEGKLRSVANPFSEHRYETIANVSKNMTNSQEIPNVVDNIDNLMRNLVVNVPEEDNAKDFQEENNKKKVEFTCIKCGSKYKKEGMLKLHVQKKHPESKWEDMVPCRICKVCQAPFASEADLKKHVSIHFKCDICSIPFDEQKYLNRHVKTHHTAMTCEVCGLECSDREQHSVHINSHWKCDQCGKSFEKYQQLKRHLKTHI